LLFDLVNDPDECDDVHEQESQVVARLMSLLERDHPGLFERAAALRGSGRLRKKKRKPTVSLVEVP
jgi:hypothetical protein